MRNDNSIFPLDDAVQLARDKQIEGEKAKKEPFGNEFAKTYPFATSDNGLDNTPLF